MKITTGVQESFYPPLYLLTLPFFYYGLYLLLVGCFKSDNKSRLLYLVILLAILLAPLPSAITEGSPSAKRFLAVLGLLEITTAYGLISFWSTVKKNKQIILAIFVTLYMVSVGHFLYFFYKVLPQKYDYVYAFKENIVSRYIEKYYSAAGYFILPTNLINQPYIYPLFHTSYDPTQFVKEKKWVDCHCPAWYTIGSFDKFILTDKIDSQTLRVLPLNKAGLLFIGPEDFQSSDFKLYLKNRSHKLLGQYQPSETVTVDRIIYVIYFYEKK
jgi:hypothetical protein